MQRRQATGHFPANGQKRPAAWLSAFLKTGGIPAIVLGLAVTGCAGSAGQNNQNQASVPVLESSAASSLTMPATKPLTDDGAGTFLAARQALYFNDVSQSANFYLETLRADSDNSGLLQQAFLTLYLRGDIIQAAATASQMEGLNIAASFRSEPATAIAIRDQDWQAVELLAESIGEHSPSIGLSALIKGWALIASGQGDAGLTHFMQGSNIGNEPSDRSAPHIILHTALMAEYIGNVDEAISAVTAIQEAEMSQLTALQIASLLARHENIKQANQFIDMRLRPTFDKARIKDLIADPAINTPPSIAQNLSSGVIDFAIQAQQSSEVRVLMARLHLARFLDPESDLANLLLGQQQISSGLLDDATASLSRIRLDGSLGQPAMIALADLANDRERFDEAILILDEAIRLNPNDGYLYKQLGDSHRRARQYRDASKAYRSALELGHGTSDTHRNLGMVLEQMNKDDSAEKHLLTAIEMNPADAFAMNYLGYWWADQGRNLDDAIALIERAVELRPDSGFFIDSLGWVHYRLGNLQEAVAYLEQATALEPADPEITGHLGDVYWRLGRHDEARFKWRYALALADDEDDIQKLEARIKSGLPTTQNNGVQD
ncbi:MAG: tetratricopeptide repeat protein [Alphaproteobacteria bacterium]